MARLGPRLPGASPFTIHPQGGRFTGESVAHRVAARAVEALAQQQQQQQAPKITCTDADCEAPPCSHFGLLVGDAPGIHDASKCRTHQPQKQQG